MTLFDMPEVPRVRMIAFEVSRTPTGWWALVAVRQHVVEGVPRLARTDYSQLTLEELCDVLTAELARLETPGAPPNVF